MRIDGSSASSIVDLHCHSAASDGALWPREVVIRAGEQGVSVLALTDHDTTAGIDEAASEAAARGIVLVPGIELSCLWRGQTIHVVGLDFDPADSELVRAVGNQENVRHARARTIDERLRGVGLPSVLSEARALAGGVPGRPHFARALLDRGIVSRTDNAFRRYLGNGKPGDVKACWPDLSEVVSWISDAGGSAILAHPRKYGLTNNKLRRLVSDFRVAGGAGLEVLSSGQSPQDTHYLTRLCGEFECSASGGSDFHEPGRHWCELGRLPALPEGLDPIWSHFGPAIRTAMERLPEALIQGE